MEFDEILEDVDSFGTYQRLMLAFVLLPGFVPCGFHAYNQLFMAASPDHWCRNPAFDGSNAAMEYIKNLSIPMEFRDGRSVFSQCYMYDIEKSQIIDGALASSLYDNGGFSNESQYPVVPCKYGWHYDLTTYSSTVVTEWDLVCDRGFYPTLALILLGLGGLVGYYIFGSIQDSLGRRPAFFIYLTILCFFGVATGLTFDFWSWLITRIGVGFTIPAITGTPLVLALELVGPAHRTLCTVLLNISYSLCLMGLAVVAYLFRGWRSFAFATVLPFITFFSFWWIMPESPRWLFANGKLKETEKILRQIAHVNGRTLPADYEKILQDKYRATIGPSKQVEQKGGGYSVLHKQDGDDCIFNKQDGDDCVLNKQDGDDSFLNKQDGDYCILNKQDGDDSNLNKQDGRENEENRDYSIFDLLKGPVLRRNTIIITILWFINMGVYVGLSYYAPVLGGDEYLNFFLAGLAELPTYLFLVPCLDNWGRRWTLFASMVVGGVACICTILVDQQAWITLSLYCVGKFGISAAFVAVQQMASEIYPTVIRGRGISFSTVVGMIGPAFVPLINYMGQEYLYLPLLILGGLMVVAGVTALALPETLGRPLPQTLMDAEQFQMECSMDSCCCPKIKSSQEKNRRGTIIKE